MPQVTIKIGTRERLEAAMLRATPMGALSTLAVVHLGALSLEGTAAAMRALADACSEAADLADAHDRERSP